MDETAGKSRTKNTPMPGTGPGLGVKAHVSSNSPIHVKIKKMSPGAKIPKLEHAGDAGFDLYANEDVTLRPLGRALVGTGIAIALPHGYEAQVRPKSGLALGHGITMLNTPGTIDAGYRGEIKAIVINLGEKEYRIEKGMKICQLVFNKIELPRFEEVDGLDTTARGHGGFGSTGLK